MVPKDKGDVETARALMKYSYSEVSDVVPELLEWIQDMNWPVASPTAEFLLTIEKDITTDIIRVMRSNDAVWKYWCLRVFGQSSDLDSELLEELRRIKANPNPGDVEEGVTEEIDIILSRYNI
jgi:hypothetical protein